MSLTSSILAKGRGGGGSSTTVDDGWDAPGIVKALMAFEVTWAIVALVQFIYVLRNLSKVASSARGPYIMLAVVTFFVFLYCTLAAAWSRIAYGFVDAATVNQLSVSITAVYTVVAAFLPGTVLYLLQQRGAVLRASKGDTVSPFSTLVWKRVVDWVLVGLTFIFYISTMANDAAYITALESDIFPNYQQYKKANNGLRYTITALIIFLSINIVGTSITLVVQAKRAQWSDPIIRRLCKSMVPLFIVFALQWLIFQIYLATMRITTLENLLVVNLAQLIIEGICILAIIAVLITTMSIPGVIWTSAGGPPPSHPEWPTSQGEKYTNPAFSTPQQQPQPFYPQQTYQHPYQQQQQHGQAYNQQNNQNHYYSQSPYSAPGMVPQQQQQPQQTPYAIPNRF